MLMIYILTGYFVRVPKTLKQYSETIVFLLFVLLCISLYLKEVMISILIGICAIIYLYSIDNSLVKKADTFDDKIQFLNKVNKVKTETIQSPNKNILPHEKINKSPHSPCSHRKQSKHEHEPLNLQTQTNIFNSLNYDLFYNELGHQFNIQGFDDIQGFDKTIYN